MQALFLSGPLSVTHFGLCVYHREKMHLGPLLSFVYIFFGLGKGKLSFKLTNLPNSSELVLGPLPTQSLS